MAVLNLSQSVRLALAAWLARVPIRAGDVDNHLGLLYHHRFTYRGLPIHISRRFEPLLEQLTGARSLTWLAVTPERFGGHRGLDSLRSAGWRGGPFITLAFGTRGYTKRWFPERETWPTLAKRFLQEGFEVVWLGGPDEVPLGRELAELAPGSLNLAGQTSLPEACALQYHAYGNVAIDTGLAHTAAGTGRPTITLIGDSPETLINPPGPRALSVRGAEVELGEPARFETYGSSAHRLTPARVANLLHALAAEAAGRTITPALG